MLIRLIEVDLNDGQVETVGTEHRQLGDARNTGSLTDMQDFSY